MSRSARSGRVFRTSARRCPAAARRVDRVRHVAEPAHRVRVGRADDLDARTQRIAHVLAAEVQSIGQAVHLQGDAQLEREAEQPLQVDGVLRPAIDDPAGRVAEAAHVRVAQRRFDALRHLAPRHPLPAMDARLHPVELGKDVIGKIEPPVGEDVALDPAQDAERRELLVRRRDLLRLAADVVGGESGDGADGGRVVADRDVLVAARLGGAGHLLDARPSVRPRGVAVEVAADVVRLEEHRRLVAERCLAQLRRTPGEAESVVDRRLVGRVRQRLERGDVGGGAGGSQQGGAETLRLGGHELDRRPVDRHAHGPATVLLDHGDDLRQLGEARQDGCRLRRGADHRELLGVVAPATHIAGRLAAERGRDASHELAAAREADPALRPLIGLARERVEELRLGLRPDPRHGPQPAGRRRCAQLVCRVDVQCARDLDRAPRPEPEIATQSDETRRELALELRELGDLARLDELAQPRLDAPADPAQLAHAARPHELGHRDRRPTDRLGGAPVRPRRVGVRLGELEQRRKGLQTVRDPCVVHSRQSSRMRTQRMSSRPSRSPPTTRTAACSAAQPAPRA